MNLSLCLGRTTQNTVCDLRPRFVMTHNVIREKKRGNSVKERIFVCFGSNLMCAAMQIVPGGKSFTTNVALSA
jgi:hypothetical protein